MKKSTGSELVSLGIFTVIIAVINVVCNLVGVFGPQAQPFGGVIAVLINGIPFALFIKRIHHFGLVTAMATLISLLSAALGDSLVAVPIALVFGLIGDLIIAAGGFEKLWNNIVGYAFFAIYPMGNLLPLLFMRDKIIESFEARSNAEWAQTFSDFLSAPMVIVMVVIYFVAGLVGGWLGQKMEKSYFSRAGL